MSVPSPITGDEVAVGESAPEVGIVDVERRHFVKFAGASGDFNPLHYDDPYAVSAGHKSVFGQGLFSGSIVAHSVADWFGLSNVSELRLRFETKLQPGDTVKTAGRIIKAESGSEGVDITASVDLVTADGIIVVSGQAEATLPY